MPTIDLLDGKIQMCQRDNSRFWQARASVGGKQRQFSTEQEARETATKAADQFLKEYGVITEGERSGKWARKPRHQAVHAPHSIFRRPALQQGDAW